MKPYGYIFEGKFYENLDDLRGRTMSEHNKPIAIYTREECIVELHRRLDIFNDHLKLQEAKAKNSTIVGTTLTAVRKLFDSIY